MNQFVTAETNETSAIVVKMSENLLGRGHCVDGTVFVIVRV
jgi:hypothetical protein